MSGLKNTFERVKNTVQGHGLKTNQERHDIRAGKQAETEQIRLDEMFASGRMPDEEVIRRNERRKAAHRRGSRLSTVLTEETLG